MKTLPPVALGTWSWGTGFAGGDTVFGNHLSDTQMAEVFRVILICITFTALYEW